MFEINKAEDLVNALTGLKNENETNSKAIGDTAVKVDSVIEELRGVKELVSQYGERKLPHADGKEYRLPVTAKEWGQHGWKALFDRPVPMKRTRDGFEMDSDPISELQSAASLMTFECALRKQDPTSANLRRTTLYKDLYLPAEQKAAGILKEAFNISTAGEGLELVPDRMTAELIQRIRLGWKVVGLFPMISMPGSPYTFPVFRDDVNSYYVPTPTSSSGTDVTEGLGTVNVTDNMVLTAARFMSRLIWSWDLNEDSILAVAGLLRDAAAASMSNAWEKAVLDGDSDGSHQDSDVSAADDVRIAFNGLRKIALAGSADKDCAGAAIDSNANWNTYVRRGVFTPMGRYGVNGADIALITGPAVSNQNRAIDRYATAEVFGNALNRLANINDGSFSPDGIGDYVVSEFVRENLNASGVYDGVTTDKTYFLVVNKKAWRVGMVPTVGFKVLDQTRAGKAQTEMIFTQRGTLAQAYDFDTTHTGIGYDVATT